MFRKWNGIEKNLYHYFTCHLQLVDLKWTPALSYIIYIRFYYSLNKQIMNENESKKEKGKRGIEKVLSRWKKKHI